MIVNLSIFTPTPLCLLVISSLRKVGQLSFIAYILRSWVQSLGLTRQNWFLLIVSWAWIITFFYFLSLFLLLSWVCMMGVCAMTPMWMSEDNLDSLHFYWDVKIKLRPSGKHHCQWVTLAIWAMSESNEVSFNLFLCLPYPVYHTMYTCKVS